MPRKLLVHVVPCLAFVVTFLSCGGSTRAIPAVLFGWVLGSIGAAAIRLVEAADAR